MVRHRKRNKIHLVKELILKKGKRKVKNKSGRRRRVRVKGVVLETTLSKYEERDRERERGRISESGVHSNVAVVYK